MKHEEFNAKKGGTGNSSWDSLREEPFRGRASNDALEDSLHYWPPEFKQLYDEPQEVPRPRVEQPERGRPLGRSSESFGLRTQTRNETSKNYENESLARHRRKMIGIFDWKAMQANQNISTFSSAQRGEISQLIRMPDNPNITPAQEDSILRDIRDGVIGVNDEKWLLEQIADPASQRGGANRVFRDLNQFHERRFLAEFGGAGFSNVDYVSPDHIENFLAKYPTPVDFESEADSFVRMIGRRNGQAKEQQYRAAKESFMQKVYGKRYEYHRDFQRLQKEASELPPDQENRGEKLSPNTGYAGIAKSTLLGIKNFVIRQIRGTKYDNPEDYNRTLRENILKRHGEGIDESQDSILIDEKNQLFGVFDGAGGVEGGRAASRLASRLVSSASKRFRLDNGKHLADVLSLANGGLVRANRNGEKIGITTGVLTKIVEGPSGERRLAYASAGDSRIYVVHENGEATQIVQDEGYENVISNYLGPSRSRSYNDAGILYRDRVTGRTENVTQYGDYPLRRGDRIVLCSDGITGDRGSDLMSSEELGYYVAQAGSAKKAAEALLANARKDDDRSVIVREAYPKTPSIGGFLDRFFSKK